MSGNRKFWKIAALVLLPIQGYVSSPFGLRVDPIAKNKRFHTGIDIVSPYAVAVKAVDEGKVLFAGKRRGYGKLVIVQGKNNVDRYYGHLGRIFVEKKDNIVPGQVLGWTGLTGRTTGTHVHYEVRVNGVPVNPATMPNIGARLGNWNLARFQFSSLAPMLGGSSLGSFWLNILENYF